MLGDEDEDERDIDLRQVLDVMVTPVSFICISNSTQKKTVRPEWDDKVFVLNCLCYLQVCPFASFLFCGYIKNCLCYIERASSV